MLISTAESVILTKTSLTIQKLQKNFARVGNYDGFRTRIGFVACRMAIPGALIKTTNSFSMRQSYLLIGFSPSKLLSTFKRQGSVEERVGSHRTNWRP